MNLYFLNIVKGYEMMIAFRIFNHFKNQSGSIMFFVKINFYLRF